MAYIAYTGTHPDGTTYGGLFNSETVLSFEGEDPPENSVIMECLYLTEEGTWIRNRVTFGNPDTSVYEAVQPGEARAWLVAHGHPEAVKRHFERPKGGRPPIGERLNASVPARMYNQIAALSEMYAEDLNDTVRRLLREALAHREEIGAPGSRDHLIAGH